MSRPPPLAVPPTTAEDQHGGSATCDVRPGTGRHTRGIRGPRDGAVRPQNPTYGCDPSDSPRNVRAPPFSPQGVTYITSRKRLWGRPG